MPGSIILKEDWSEYDEKKLTSNEDVYFFNCKQEWEVLYLFNVLQKRFDFLISESTLMKAISATCDSFDQPVSRELFVDQVMLKLIS